VNNFWQKLPRPFFCLAPMADVTDPAFRRVIAKYGRPDVFWTEFVSADALCHPEGKKKVLPILKFSKKEKPIVAQLFTNHPDKLEEAARLIVKLGFDGLDLNFGCPDKSIEKSGSGAVLMRNSKLARELIVAAKRGVAGKIPVSVKTRLGYNQDELETWLPELLAEAPAAITIHARTRKEMSKVPARWGRIKRAVEIRNKLKSKTLIIGNGDVIDLADARKKAKESGADGVMFGRAIFGNPFLFNPKKKEIKIEEKLKILLEHTKLFEKLCRPPAGGKSFAVMKKHFKAYVTGWKGAKELRADLMAQNKAKNVEKVIKDYLRLTTKS